MRLTCAKADLIAALSVLARVVERRSTIPILNYILIERAADGAALLRGTDLDMECAARLPLADGAVDATIAAPAHLMHDIARRLPDKATVTLSIDRPGDDLTISCGRMKANIHTLPPDDYPQTPGQKEPARFDLPAAALAALFGRSAFAISAEETRYYLNGAYLHPAGDHLRAVATDGHRLARIDVDLPADAAFAGVIVPRKACGEIVKLAEAAGKDATVAVAIDASRAGFDFGGVSIVTKTIDGTFPDYARVIPTGNGAIARIDRAALIAAVERVSTIATERGRAVKLEFADGMLRLSAIDVDVGSAREEIECDFSENPVEIGFNNAYLSEMLRGMAGREVKVSMADAGAPTLFEDTSDETGLFVLMPMRV